MHLEKNDPIWKALREEVAKKAESEPILASYLHATVLNHTSLENALSFHLANKLSSPSLQSILMCQIMNEAFTKKPSIAIKVRSDLKAVEERDPASHGYSEPFLHFKGFHALQAYRVAHFLWKNGRKALACHLQNRMSEVFGVDIHPAARIGQGIFIDHATSVVIGETAVVDDDVSMLHEVTLGGTGNITGDRHPKVRRGVLIGAGAKILGNVTVGEGAKIAAGSVVLSDVPPHSTVAGVPAEVVGKPFVDKPALEMNQFISKQ